jgi:hypothetical protein
MEGTCDMLCSTPQRNNQINPPMMQSPAPLQLLQAPLERNCNCTATFQHTLQCYATHRALDKDPLSNAMRNAQFLFALGRFFFCGGET